MKMILSAIVTLSAVAAFANSPDTTTGTTTGTTSTTTTETAPATTQHTTTTTKEAKTKTHTMTKEQAEKACAKDANKAACVQNHMSGAHTM